MYLKFLFIILIFPVTSQVFPLENFLLIIKICSGFTSKIYMLLKKKKKLLENQGETTLNGEMFFYQKLKKKI